MKREIDVLLALYNGEKFIADFLESLKAQRGVKINLLIGNDGSEDNSEAIIDCLLTGEVNFEVFHFSNVGTCEVFLNLLQKATSEYVAFADQDDVWNPDHLLDAIARMDSFSTQPVVMFSRVQEVDVYLNPIRIYPDLKVKNSSLADFVFRNPARGCTMVINRELYKIINCYRPVNAVMHDWWIFLVGYICGKVVFRETPKVLYRIHDLNQIGVNGRNKLVVLYELLTGRFKPLTQFCEILQEYGNDFPFIDTKSRTFLYHYLYIHSDTQRNNFKYFFKSFSTNIIEKTVFSLALLIQSKD